MSPTAEWDTAAAQAIIEAAGGQVIDEQGHVLLTRGRVWVSGVGIGLAFVIPFNTCLAMFLGSFLFWLAGRRWQNPETLRHQVFVKNLEPVCAGIIAGGALMGIAVILIETFALS